MRQIKANPGNDASCSRRKDLFGKKVPAADGYYVISRGKPGEHTISVRGGYVDNGDSPAILYRRDQHTEYWTRGYPQTRSDGSPAICSGGTAEFWSDGVCERIEKIHTGMEVGNG